MAERACGCCTLDAPTGTPTCYSPVDELLDVGTLDHGLAMVGLLGNDGPKRHSEVADALDVNSSSVLANRLRELTAAGLLHRRNSDRVPPHVEHSLTAAGRSSEQRLRPLLEWVPSDGVTADPE